MVTIGIGLGEKYENSPRISLTTIIDFNRDRVRLSRFDHMRTGQNPTGRYKKARSQTSILWDMQTHRTAAQQVIKILGRFHIVNSLR